MKKNIKKIFSLFTLPMIGVYAPVYAAVSEGGWNPQALEKTNLPGGTVENILLNFIDWAIIIVGLICLVIFIYGGFLYMTAQGETDKIETAKKVVIYAVIGVAVSVLGFVAVKTVNDLLTGGSANSGAGANTASPAGSPSMSPGGPGGPSGGDQLPVAPNMVGN